MHVNNFQSYQVLGDIETTFTELKSHLGFSPAYFAYRRMDGGLGKTLNSEQDTESGDIFVPKNADAHNEDCLSDGVFCVQRMDSHPIESNSDSPLVETVKQLCVYETGMEQWLSYISQFRNFCFEGVMGKSEPQLAKHLAKCSAQIKIDHLEEVINCTNEILSSKKPLEHPVIAHNTKKLEFFHTYHTPTFVVNGVTLKGDLTEASILEDLCESITPKLKECFDMKTRKEAAATNPGNGGGYNYGLMYGFKLFLQFGGVALILLLLFYVAYKMKLRKELDNKLNEKMNDALSKYYMTDKASEYSGAQYQGNRTAEYNTSSITKDVIEV